MAPARNSCKSFFVVSLYDYIWLSCTFPSAAYAQCYPKQGLRFRRQHQGRRQQIVEKSLRYTSSGSSRVRDVKSVLLRAPEGVGAPMPLLDCESHLYSWYPVCRCIHRCSLLVVFGVYPLICLVIAPPSRICIGSRFTILLWVLVFAVLTQAGRILA